MASRVYRVAAAHAGLRADVFLALHEPTLSCAQAARLIQSGGVRVNGHRMASSTRLRAGDLLEVESAPQPAFRRWVEPAVLYEDEWLLALDKPAGLAVHPAGRRWEGTLIQAVRERLRDEIRHHLAMGDRSFSPRLVYRLDLFTSGVVLVAKDHQTLVRLHRELAAGGVRKRYVAIAVGWVEPEAGVIDAPIGRASGSSVAIRRAVRADGAPARTEYRVLEYLRDHSLLEVLPRTGRQHQVRVHLAWIGHPVWGDLLYPDEQLFLRYWAGGCRLDASLPRRHALHAEKVTLRHPVSGRCMEISSPLPRDFLEIRDALRLA